MAYLALLVMGSETRAHLHRGKNWDGFGNVWNPDEVGGVLPTVGEANVPNVPSPNGPGFENTPVGRSVGCVAARGTGACSFIVPCCASGRAAPDVGSLAPSRRVSVTPPWVKVGPPGDTYFGPTVTVNVGNFAPI
jgi:hypothetical protein